MKFPENREDVKREILISAEKSANLNDLRLRQLILILTKVPQDFVAEGAIDIFATEQDFQSQEYAGRILKELEPQSSLDLETLLPATIKNWNKSVEELPLWFVKNYGLHNFLQALDRFEKSDCTSEEKDKVKTMKWWIMK